MNELIPPPDPLGIPSPPFLFDFLYILTFFLHVVFMNFILGGSIIVAIQEGFLARKETAIRANGLLLRVMPVALSMAITMGVAPLLFVQVLYGQFFYTSNIILGWFWMAILGLAIAGFYFIYLQIARRPAENASTPLTKSLAFLNALIFLFIAFLFTSNAVLVENTSHMPDLYTGKVSLFFFDSTILPRYLHNVLGALAVAGLWSAVIGRYHKRFHPEHADTAAFLEKSGLWWATVPTALQFIAGTAFLLSIGMDRLKLFMNGGILFWGWSLSILAALGALVLMALALARPEKPKLLWLAVGHMAVTLAGMAMGRDLLRKISLADTFSIQALEVRASYSSLLLFLVTFVVGLLAVGYLVKLVWTLPSRPAGNG